jgi:hypothetical protein
MRRTLLVVLLSVGAVLGFASGFAHLHAWRHGGHGGACWVHGHRPPPGSPPPASP